MKCILQGQNDGRNMATFRARSKKRLRILFRRRFKSFRPAFLGVLNLRKVQTKDTSIIALEMEKSGLRTAAKPLGSPIFLENALFLLKKYEAAAFVLVDKSGCFYVKERPKGHQTIERTPKRHSGHSARQSTLIQRSSALSVRASPVIHRSIS